MPLGDYMGLEATLFRADLLVVAWPVLGGRRRCAPVGPARLSPQVVSGRIVLDHLDRPAGGELPRGLLGRGACRALLQR